MSKSRIWAVIQEPNNDEGNSYERAVFDNEEAANRFIDEVHHLEYKAYVEERNDWAGGKPEAAPPPAVNYAQWMKSDFRPILVHGIVTTHMYDSYHEITRMRVEPDWLYGNVPPLVWQNGVHTEDEVEALMAAMAAIPTYTSRRGLRRARREAREREADGSTSAEGPRGR